MTTVFVDLVNLDGSRPEGSLRFSLERLVLGDPDVVPSAVEVKIRDGKARVDGLLPGAMRVRVNAGCWSKDWQVTIPESGEHDLFALLGEQAKEFEHALWSTLLGRVEKLEQVPPVDLAPVEQRLDALEGAPKVDLAPLEKRVTALEAKPSPEPFDPTELKTQLAELRAHFTPVALTWLEGPGDDFSPVFDTGTAVSTVQHAGRVNIDLSTTVSAEALIRALDGLQLPHFPAVSMFPDDGRALCSVELFQGAKFLTKLELNQIRLQDRGGTLTFVVALDDVLAVVQETGANRMSLSTFYYTNELPPETD
ncbi:hypothetical protein [Corynebacterium sp. LK26]|uniref:hypothetical protein n=1 Tax=Corynebacterium sp. LK26 TaxID=2044581 RepID=UPI001651C74E|nr:hypothetical protein [Corynebacterium sp. LK26]